MMDPGTALSYGLGGALSLWATAVTVTSAVATRRAWLHRRSPAVPRRPRLPSVVVVRPCAGLEPHLERSLRSTASLRYSGPLRIVFSTSTPDDPACPLLHRIAGQLRREGIEAEVRVIPPCGPNLKASQLSGIIDVADDEIAMVIDSDVELSSMDLDELLAPLLDRSSRVGAVWCPPVEREPSGLGDRLSAAVLGGSLHAFPLLGTLDPGGMVGKTFAIRTDALRHAGGFGSLVRHLGEDMELARRLAEHGWSVSMGATVVTSLASGRRARDVLARYARWLMVIRAQRPALLLSYPLLLAATPLLLLAAAVGWMLGLPTAGIAMIATVAGRVGVTLVARRLAGRRLAPSGVLLDAVLADLVLLAAFARALGPARVRWRERSLRLGARGLLEAG